MGRTVWPIGAVPSNSWRPGATPTVGAAAGYPSSMRVLPVLLFVLGLQATAKADRFWLSDPGAKVPEGTAPDCIEGVLLAEGPEGYHVRIVGGEVLLPKSAVVRVEKDGLTVAQIVQRETELAAQRGPAPIPAAAPGAAPAAAKKPAAIPVEATAKRGDAIPAPAAAQPPAQAGVDSGYDPVLHRRQPAPGASVADLRAELQLAWTLTKDKRYLTALRQLRRHH